MQITRGGRPLDLRQSRVGPQDRMKFILGFFRALTRQDDQSEPIWNALATNSPNPISLQINRGADNQSLSVEMRNLQGQPLGRVTIQCSRDLIVELSGAVIEIFPREFLVDGLSDSQGDPITVVDAIEAIEARQFPVLAQIKRLSENLDVMAEQVDQGAILELAEDFRNGLDNLNQQDYDALEDVHQRVMALVTLFGNLTEGYRTSSDLIGQIKQSIKDALANQQALDGYWNGVVDGICSQERVQVMGYNELFQELKVLVGGQRQQVQAPAQAQAVAAGSAAAPAAAAAAASNRSYTFFDDALLSSVDGSEPPAKRQKMDGEQGGQDGQDGQNPPPSIGGGNGSPLDLYDKSQGH